MVLSNRLTWEPGFVGTKDTRLQIEWTSRRFSSLKLDLCTDQLDLFPLYSDVSSLFWVLIDFCRLYTCIWDWSNVVCMSWKIMEGIFNRTITWWFEACFSRIRTLSTHNKIVTRGYYNLIIRVPLTHWYRLLQFLLDVLININHFFY